MGNKNNRKPAKRSAKRDARKAASQKKTSKATAKRALLSRNRKQTKVIGKPRPTAPQRKGVQLKAKADTEEVLIDSTMVKEVETVLTEGVFTEFVVKNVGKSGIDLINNLNSAPHTDDKLATKMEIKVNEVRRMLNVLNGYGITKYDINKDGKGWLTFKWYLDREKMIAFRSTLTERTSDANLAVNGECNDFFYCVSCYNDQKVILPFESAFDINFTCECGKALSALDKIQVSALVKENQTV